MTIFLVKLFLSAFLIAFCSWLAGRQPELAGFLIALPLSTLLALGFSYAEFQDPQACIVFARSIFVAIPVTLLFFVPFLLADRLRIGFWGIYGLGLALLSVGYFAHRGAMQYFSR